MINLKDVEVVNDQESPYGLVFKLKDSAQPIYAPILNKDGNFSSEDIDEAGLPKKVGKLGDRHLYVDNNGLCRLFLNRDLNLYSYGDNLGGSYSGSRVVVVGGASAQKHNS